MLLAQDDPYLLAAGESDDPADLEMTLVALLLREGRGQLPALRAKLALARASGEAPDLSPLHADLAQLRPICEAAIRDLEPAYLAAHRHRQCVAAHREAQAAFVAAFRARLRCIGTDVPPQSFSHIGWVDDDAAQPLGLSRDSGHLILGAGVQGSGKSVLGTVLAEGGLHEGGEPLSSSELPKAAAAFFHIEEHDRLPHLLDGLRKNAQAADLALLAERLGVKGAPLPRLRLAVPPKLLPDLLPRLLPYQDLGLEMRPLLVHLSELGQPGLEAALGADSGARFVQRMLDDAQDQGRDLSLPRMRRFIDDAEDLNAAMKRAAHARLHLLEGIAAPQDGPGLWHLFEPGVATVVYLGGPHMGHGRVAPLLVGLLSGLLMPSPVHGPFQRLITVDEVNLLARDDAVWPAFIRTARLVRHRGATLVLLGQDLLCIPDELFGLAGICAVFQQRNPRVFEHIRDRVGALRGVRFDEVAGLGVGEALLASTHGTTADFCQGARRVRIRPPLCAHGGFTRAVV